MDWSQVEVREAAEIDRLCAEMKAGEEAEVKRLLSRTEQSPGVWVTREEFASDWAGEVEPDFVLCWPSFEAGMDYLRSLRPVPFAQGSRVRVTLRRKTV